MKKIILVVLALLATSAAKADSISASFGGSDNSQPSYGLAYTFSNRFGYLNLEDSTTAKFQQNTPIVSLGANAGPFNSGLVFGSQITQTTGTVSGLFGVEAGVSIPLAGPLYVQENNRLLRGAGGVSDSSMTVSLGFRL
jgi:hypothetical protein